MNSATVSVLIALALVLLLAPTVVVGTLDSPSHALEPTSPPSDPVYLESDQKGGQFTQATTPGNTDEAGSIVNIRPVGDGYVSSQYRLVQDHPGPPFVWLEEPTDMRIETAVDDPGDQYELCGAVLDTEGNTLGEIECTTFAWTGDALQTVYVSVDEWPVNETGLHQVQFTLHNESGEQLDRREIRLHLIEQEGDLDGEGLTNEREVALGTDFTVADTSGNGLTDWEEVERHGTDPLAVDTTGDGISDGTVVRLGLDPTRPYTVHLHLAAGLVVFTSVVGVIVITTLKLLGIPLREVGVIGPPGTTTTSNGMHDPQSSAVEYRDPGSGDIGDMDRESDPATDRLLTDEEYICRMLEASGGRMKQAQIVAETDWSKAKVSRVLSRLEDEGVIEKLRVGRENLVELTDHESDMIREHRAPGQGSNPDHSS